MRDDCDCIKAGDGMQGKPGTGLLHRLPDGPRGGIIDVCALVEILWETRTRDGMLITARYNQAYQGEGLGPRTDVLATAPSTL